MPISPYLPLLHPQNDLYFLTRIIQLAKKKKHKLLFMLHQYFLHFP
jgi:hypothetical protein